VAQERSRHSGKRSTPVRDVVLVRRANMEISNASFSGPQDQNRDSTHCEAGTRIGGGRVLLGGVDL
jgi:hypothetical protein